MSRVKITGAELASRSSDLCKSFENDAVKAWLEQKYSKPVESIRVDSITGTIDLDIEVQWKEAKDGFG